MQSTFRPNRFILSLSTAVLIFVTLWLVSQTAQAQTVAGYPNQGGAIITGVVSKGAGQADITISGVQLKSTLSYCLVGVGRGHWHVKKIDGAMQFDLTKVACAKPEGGKVTLSLKLDPKHYQSGGITMGYVPVSVQPNGMFADWQAYPAGSQKFEKNDGKQSDIIAIQWTTDGYATVATAAQALNIND